VPNIISKIIRDPTIHPNDTDKIIKVTK